MQRNPRVSIGLPVYNGARHLRAAIDSFLGQTFADFELIISDNASTDETEGICRAYASRDRRILYSRLDRNIGAAGNFNRAFHQSRGEYFKWAAHDDVCLPAFLEHCVAALDAGPRVVLSMTKTTLIDADGGVIGDQDDNLEFRHPRAAVRMAQFATRILASGCHSAFGLIRADTLRRTRLIDRFVGADIVLLGELAVEGELWELPERLFRSRIHGGCSHQLGSADAYAQWFDPSARRTFAGFVRTRLLVEQLRSISKSSLSPVEKAATAAAFSAAWTVRQARVDGGAAKRRLFELFRERFATRRPGTGVSHVAANPSVISAHE